MMGVFEYLGVILSVIMGLGLTHILVGISKTIHHRKTVKAYWVHSLWAFNVLVYIVAIWWGMFWWSTQLDWAFHQFLMLILYAIVLFLLASLLYPWDIPDEFDFEQHFYETRPWFFSVLALGWILDIPETLAKSEAGLRSLPQAYVVLAGTFIITAICAAVWSNRTFHKIVALLWGSITITYLSITTLSEIATT